MTTPDYLRRVGIFGPGSVMRIKITLEHNYESVASIVLTWYTKYTMLDIVTAKGFFDCKYCVRVNNCPQGTLSIRIQIYYAHELYASLENSCTLSRNICVFLVSVTQQTLTLSTWPLHAVMKKV